MQKITLAALSLVLALPSFAYPVKPATKNNSKPNNTSAAASKPKHKSPTNTSSNKPASGTQPASKPVLLSKTIVPDGKTPIANVKITPVPDVSPTASGQYVVINIPQQRLFLYQNGALQKVYPVAVGKAVTQTNLGEHKIGGKAFDPTWHIPKSIQAELKDGRTTVPPGPDNPLGPVFVRLGNPKLGLGIHGTNAPSSVPGVRSHGCVRMKSEQALDFAHTIETGADAIVSYEMATLNVDSNNQLWLTVFRDPYSKNNLNIDALKKSIQAWAGDNNITISDVRVNQIIKARKAVPVCISCSPKTKNTVSGSLMSIAWNSGTSALTTPKGLDMAVPPILDEEDNLDEIEVEADVTEKGRTLKPVVPAKSVKSVGKNKTPNVPAASSPEEGERVLQPETSVVHPVNKSKKPVSKPKTPVAKPEVEERILRPETSTPSPVSKPSPGKVMNKPVVVSTPVPAANKLKTNNKVKVKSTSAFDDNVGVGVETPLHPIAPMNGKPSDGNN